LSWVFATKNGRRWLRRRRRTSKRKQKQQGDLTRADVFPDGHCVYRVKHFRFVISRNEVPQLDVKIAVSLIVFNLFSRQSIAQQILLVASDPVDRV
jgi:hypothetical protein